MNFSECILDQNYQCGIDLFLKSCNESSTQAYENFKCILEMIDKKAETTKIRVFLHNLEQHLKLNFSIDESLNKFYFAFSQLTITQEKVNHTLKLLQLPSIFTPEEWSFTFYEGLARYPKTEFHDRKVTELGCGNGWISIALAIRCLPQKIIGLDINPRAISCAKINLFLNSLNCSGTIIVDEEGKSLADRVEFHTSDLLEYCRTKEMTLDRIIGCIPQVLSPDPEIAQKIIAEGSDDDFLYSLSNYCGMQGLIEDQFGLGLVARAVEESVERLKPSGKIIMNLGGRPGNAVLQRLFTRRGFDVQTIWQTKVTQAQDTDIKSLVEIEQNSPHRFEFFVSLNSDEPINAQTAFAFVKNGGNIAHSLNVYEAKLRQPIHIKRLFNFLNDTHFAGARSALDLSYKDPTLADEKSAFLASLADWLSKSPHIPYEDTEGLKSLRSLLADYMRNYWRIPFDYKNIFISPSRSISIRTTLNLLSPKLVLLDRILAKDLHTQASEFCSANGEVQILETPQRIDLTCSLMQKLRPQLVVTGLAEFENKTVDSFIRLIETARNLGTKLLIDVSPYFDLSSTPQSCGVFQYLLDNCLPDHVIIMCGLVKNRVYPDMELCFLISENREILRGFSSAAELTYSRVPVVSQIFYEQLLSDLLNFQMSATRREKMAVVRNLSNNPSLNEDLPEYIKRAFLHPAVAEHEVPLDAKTIRLDYGENILHSPSVLQPALMEAFASQNLNFSEDSLSDEIKQHLQTRFGINSGAQSYLIPASGVAPLFANLAMLCNENSGTFVFPNGCYGHFQASAEFLGCTFVQAPTSKEDFFKWTPKSLNLALKKAHNPWIYLNAPVVNPTGAIYSWTEIDDILAIAQSYNSVIIIDSIFSGLEFSKQEEPWALEERFQLSPNSIVILGGLSKEFSAGGLRFGYAYFRNQKWNSAMKKGFNAAPHSTIKSAAKRIYNSINSLSPDTMADLSEQRRILKGRSLQLKTCLEANGWEVCQNQGGLFLVASPVHLIGKTLKTNNNGLDLSEKVNFQNVTDLLHKTTGLLINNPTWTGIEGFCRFVLSVSESDFEKSIDCLKSFKKLCSE